MRSWDGSCDPSCIAASPCDFNNTNAGYTLSNITILGCRLAIAIDSNSDLKPVLTLNTANFKQAQVGNITFVQVNTSIAWKSLDITTSLLLSFIPLDTSTSYTMLGNATFRMQADGLIYFSNSKAVTFQGLILSDPRFTFQALAPTVDHQFTTPSAAAVSASFIGCHFLTSNNATGSSLIFDTSLVTTLTGTASITNPAYIKMIYYSEQTDYELSSSTDEAGDAYHVSFTSYKTVSATATVNWVGTTVTGRTLGLIKTNAAKGSTGGPPLTFTAGTQANFGLNNTLFESVRIAASNFSGAHFQMTLSNMVNATFSPVVGSVLHTSLSNIVDGQVQLYASSSVELSGLQITAQVIQTSSASFINCNLLLLNTAWNVQGYTSISYQDSVTPTPSVTGGAQIVGSIANTSFLFADEAALYFLTDYSTNTFASTFRFKDTTFLKAATSSNSSDCLVRFDEEMQTAGPTTIITQCNFTSTGLTNYGSDLTNVSALAGAYGTYGPSLSIATVAPIGKINLFLSNFRHFHLTPTHTDEPFFLADPASTVYGLPKSGFIIDWDSNLSIQPEQDRSYLAFETLEPSLSSVQQLNSTASTLTSKLFIITYTPQNDSMGTTMVNFTQGTLPPPAAPPVEEPVSAPAASPPTQPPTAPTALVCSGASPGPSFTCVNGVWVSNGTVEQQTVVISTTSVVIAGNLTVQTITFSGTSHNVTVIGCVSTEGITLDLTKENPGSLSGKTVTILSQGSNCSSSLSTIPLAIKQPENDCAKVKSTSSTTSSSSQTSLSVLFSLDKSGCNTKWIIVGSVVGGVVVLGVVATIVAVTVIKKHKASRSRSNLREAAL